MTVALTFLYFSAGIFLLVTTLSILIWAVAQHEKRG